MNPLQIHLLKSEIKHACWILKVRSTESQSSWIRIARNIISKMDLSQNKISQLTEELEELALLLLLRTTTNLNSIHLPGLYETAQEILQRMTGLNFCDSVFKGISEFVLDTEKYLQEEQKQKEVIALKNQLYSLNKDLTQYQNSDKADRFTQTSPAPIIEKMSNLEDKTLKSNDKYCFNQVDLKAKLSQDNTFGDFSSDKKANEVKHKDSLPFAKLDFIGERETKDFSCCILDIEGKFIMTDERAEKIFGANSSQLFKKNFFDLLIPFSLFHLKKTMGKFIFSQGKSDSKVFSYTVYSNSAIKAYQKAFNSIEKKGESHWKKVKERGFTTDEKQILPSNQNAVYYKYLQTLTSRSKLINFKFSTLGDLLRPQAHDGIKFNLEHPFFQRLSDKPGVKTFPAVLLITRKAYHVQNFPYSLLEKFDENIFQMEERIQKCINKKKAKIQRKFDDFQNRVELNHIIISGGLTCNHN